MGNTAEMAAILILCLIATLPQVTVGGKHSNVKSMGKLMEKVDSLMEGYDKLKKEVKSYKSLSEGLQKEVAFLRKDNKEMRIMLASTRSAHNLNPQVATMDQAVKLPSIYKETDEVKRAISDEEPEQTENSINQHASAPATAPKAGSVAFMGIRTTEMGPVSGNTIINYDVTELNVGSGFNRATGTFTAPQSGIYTIHFSGQQYGTQYDSWMFLMHNKALVCCAWGLRGSTSTIGNTATLTLQAKDTLEVVLGNGYYIYSDRNRYITFSGELVG